MDNDRDVPSVADQRTLFLVNTFVIHTVRHLNNFAALCEEKLADVHRRILRADATLCLLEDKLRSVDGLEEAGEQVALDVLPDLVLPVPATETSQDESTDRDLGIDSKSGHSRSNSVAAQSSDDQPPLFKVKEDPQYAKFFRMLQVGVPLPAVKLQMNLEGLDPSVLDAADTAP